MNNKIESKPDVTVEGHGNIYLFRLHTDTAREWVNENVSEDRQMFGGALAVEHRYASELAAGMSADGLAVS